MYLALLVLLVYLCPFDMITDSMKLWDTGYHMLYDTVCIVQMITQMKNGIDTGFGINMSK